MRQARWTPPALLAAATVCIVAVKGYPCGSPGQPLHGIVRPRSQLFYAGENVTVTCEPGFVRFGEFSRACTPDGTWHGLMPFCSRNVAYLGSTQGPALPLGPPIELGQFEPRLAADGDARTCSSTPPHVRERWWQVRLPSRTHVESVGLVVRPGYSLDVSIFIISLNTQQPDSANYQQCANFTGVQLEAKRLFYCGSQGLMGEYVYIRDEKRRPDYLTLCEVEVFAFGDERGCGEPEQPAYWPDDADGRQHGHLPLPQRLPPGRPPPTTLR
ncbi:uncharacterized protein LOC119112570 [Pollicipes pollicipes]|uniref:uncharacterized protein LOC119112570 n=1 Tax=Pollicipes pollicipes TaxID=41117 RepID=UPI00188581DE|nr:uncharacterized protein LOC119112570 [Pollicipes pollicipes]